MPKNNENKVVTDTVDDESIYVTADAVTPEGGEIKKRKADVNKVVDAKADTVKADASMAESFVDLFEGADLSDEFKKNAQLVFEAAVNEASTAKTATITEALEAEFATKLEESIAEAETNMNASISESMDEAIENLDTYLDYIVNEWMEENEIAIESGVKVDMAESLMEGLMSLFAEHNLDLDEEKMDVVADLETKLAESTNQENAMLSKNIALVEEVSRLNSEKVFNDVCEDLTQSQKERMRILSEKLDHSEADEYKSDLTSLKESFFKKEKIVISEDVADETEILVEDTTTKRHSEYDSVNSIVAALDKRQY